MNSTEKKQMLLKQFSYVESLERIVQAADNIMDYMKGMTKAQFMKNEMTMDAVIINLERIGRAARLIPQSVQKKDKEIPWDAMYDTAVTLLSDYYRLDDNAIW